MELPTQQSDPVYELMVELYTIVNHAQKRLRWTDDVFAEKAGYTDRSILDRTRREVREILSGQDVAIGAPLPIPKWNVVLSFAWAICDDNPSPEFSEWIVTLRRKHVAAKLARPDERGNTTKMRALHKEKRGNARLEPSSDMVEMSPSMREILYQLTG